MALWRNLIAHVLVMAACLLSGCADVRERGQPALAAGEEAGLPAEYRLGVGDIISIRVYDWRAGTTGPSGDDDLKLEKVRLDHSGIVSLPFGQFQALGATLKGLEEEIVKSLRGRLLKNPRVWINIEEYRPFFVEGQVTRPGAYPYQPGLNVRKAITIGGGFRERASLEKIFVVREGDKSQSRVRVNLNSVIGPGDTITVDESFF